MSRKRVSTVDWDKDIYNQGMQLNHWPYTDVVSDVLRLTARRDRKTLRFLEIGCGAGNNLWFAAESGFSVYGLDMSTTAIQYATGRLSGLGYNEIDLRVGDLTLLPWPDDFFDIVLDRGALTQNSYAGIQACLKEVYRVLRPNTGMLLAYTLYGLNDDDLKYGEEVSKNTYDNFTGGYFKNVGLTSFFSERDIRSIFCDFNSLTIKRQLHENLDTGHLREAFSISCAK